MQMSYLKDKPNIWAGPKWDLPEVVGPVTQYYTYLCTRGVNQTVSCTRPTKIADEGVGLPHLGVPGRSAWPTTGEGPRTFDIIYTTQEDRTPTVLVGIPANI